jgi:hypothetical protein
MLNRVAFKRVSGVTILAAAAFLITIGLIVDGVVRPGTSLAVAATVAK